MPENLEQSSGKLELGATDAGVGVVALAAIGGAAAYGLNAKSNVGAVLAFAGAILVALLTAYWTQRRQTKDLAAAERRQKAELAAEAARLRAQLDHERTLHDLAELRKVLDEAMLNAELAKDAFLDLRRVVTRPSLDDQLHQHVFNELQQRAKPVAQSAVRITTRGLDHLALALWEFVGALKVPSINPALPDREQVRLVWTDAQATLADRQATFINLVKGVAASELPARPDG